MSLADLHEPILLELGERSWTEALGSTERWLDNVLMTQAAFRQLAEDTLEKAHEPHIREYLAAIVETAKEHEQKVDELYRIIGREPSRTREAAGELAAKARQAMADLTGAAGGAVGAWRDLHQLFLASLNAISAFGAAEQLGLALGITEIVDITLKVTSEKFQQHRQLQELILDMAPMAILYKMDI